MSVDLERTRALFRRMEQLLGKTRSQPLPERVHQVRTTARRLETLLGTLCSTPDRRTRRLLKRLARLRRRAGGVRDVDVQMMALRKLKIGREDRRKARLMQALAEMRAVQEKRLFGRLTDNRVRKLRKTLRRTLAEVVPAEGRAATSSEPETPREAAAGPAPAQAALAAMRQPESHPVELGLRMFARIARKYGSLTSDNIHEYRTQGKHVRYVAEMAGADPEAEHMVKLLKRQQDSVGDWHDWFTLTQTAESVFARSPDCALLAALRNVTNAKFVEARRVCLDVRRELLARYRARLAARRAGAKPRRAPQRSAVSGTRAANSGVA